MTFYFEADPDPTFHFDAYTENLRIRIRIRILLIICDKWSRDPPRLHSVPPRASTALHGSILSLLQLLNFYFGADPDTAFDYDADPAFHSHTDPDPAF
jgi:hypothetical protein